MDPKPTATDQWQESPHVDSTKCLPCGPHRLLAEGCSPPSLRCTGLPAASSPASVESPLPAAPPARAPGHALTRESNRSATGGPNNPPYAFPVSPSCTLWGAQGVRCAPMQLWQPRCAPQPAPGDHHPPPLTAPPSTLPPPPAAIVPSTPCQSRVSRDRHPSLTQKVRAIRRLPCAPHQHRAECWCSFFSR